MSKRSDTNDQSRDETSPVGIDFGTSYSSISYAVPNARGDIEVRSVVHEAHFSRIPTAVYLRDIVREQDGEEVKDLEYIVGEEALELGALSPERLYKDFKRNLGENLRTLEDNSEVSANQLAKQVLSYLLHHAEEEGFKDVRPVVCHPVGGKWAEIMSRLLHELGVSAVMLTEPEAALYYAHHKYHIFDEKDETILLIDFGGGTCDFLLMKVKTMFWNRLLTRPVPSFIDDDRLDFAGQDIDEIVMDHLIKQWLAANPGLEKYKEEFNQPKLKWSLKKKAREIKHVLSKNYERGLQSNELPIEIFGFPGNSKLETTMTPMKLRELTEAIIRHHFRWVLLQNDEDRNHKALLGRNGLEPKDITKVIVTGGSSQLPWVSKEILPEIFPSLARRKLILNLDNPSMSVSYGAALYAYDKGHHRQRLKRFLQEDLKIELEDGTVYPLVNRGTELPVERKLLQIKGYETFKFPRTGRELSIKLVAGDGHRAADLRPLSSKPGVLDCKEEIPAGTQMDMEVEINEKGEVHLYISKSGFWHSKLDPLIFPSILRTGTDKGAGTEQ